MTATQVQFRRGTAAQNDAFTGATGEITVDTTNFNLRVHDGTTAGGFLVGGFASGTKMLFQQTTAPVGWTKVTTHDNKAIRVVSGSVSSGGSSAFTDVFGSGITTGSHSLSSSENASHTHSGSVGSSANTNGAGGVTSFSVFGSGNDGNLTLSIGSSGSGTGHSHTLSMDLQYVDCIIAQKD